MSWLEEICKANDRFKEQIDADVLPRERQACPYAVITCMDPRINLESIGVRPFTPNGALCSQIRIIRTIGGMHDIRSLVVGIHLAGFKEIAVMMHTDCGCSLAYHNIDKIIKNMESALSSSKLRAVKKTIGEPFREELLDWLQAFQDPWEAVAKEVAAIKNSPFVPDEMIVHGLVYDLSSGSTDVAVDGYDGK